MSTAQALLCAGLATVVVHVLIWRALGGPATTRSLTRVAGAALLDLWSMVCEVVVPPGRLAGGAAAARVLAGAWLVFLLSINVALKSLLLTESAFPKATPYPQTMVDLLAAVPDLIVGVPSKGGPSAIVAQMFKH